MHRHAAFIVVSTAVQWPPVYDGHKRKSLENTGCCSETWTISTEMGVSMWVGGLNLDHVAGIDVKGMALIFFLAFLLSAYHRLLASAIFANGLL